jgi:hypothetical protein
VLADNRPALSERVRPGDVVIVHDPQSAGLIAALRAAGRRSCGAATSASTGPTTLPVRRGSFCSRTSPTPMCTCSRAGRSPGTGWIASGSP